MKNTKLAVGLVVGSCLLALGLIAGCGSSSSSEQCQKAMDCGSQSLSACCTDTNCRYKSSDGQTWACSGSGASNCQSAAQSAANWCLAQ
jgi:hypothetical protein